MCAVIMERIEADGRRRRCNATCHNAKHPTCTCICEGRYHGSAMDRAGGGAETKVQAVGMNGDHACPVCGESCNCGLPHDGFCVHCEGRMRVVLTPMDTLPLFAVDMT